METDVVVIGGGATGLGVAWDLALRGIRVVVVEMGDVVTGTSGRYHGLLHTGARYAVSDQESAAECYHEHQIMRRIAPHVLEDTGGLFVLTPADDEAFVGHWVTACGEVGIPHQELSVAEARRREPALSQALSRVFAVPDAACDSVALGASLRAGITAQGGQVLTYQRVTELHRDAAGVQGVGLRDLRTGQEQNLRAAITVNASGPWSGQIGALAGVPIQMQLSRGAMLGYNGRWTSAIINRLHRPGDGDIFIPLGPLGIAGTTSVPTDDPFDTRIEPWERERILTEISVVIPALRQATILREWAGVRPLFDPATQASSEDGEHVDGRKAARTFEVLDHAARDSLQGLLSIVGGKLTTFRLMAERTADAVCARIGNTQPCRTATTPLDATSLHPTR